ncbi:DUF1868 domain-containing protein [Trichothermofontia sp.]
MDDTYQDYCNRVIRLTTLETYQSQSTNIQESPKFQPMGDGSYQATPFPGYTIITPPWAEVPADAAFFQQLATLQAQLLAALPQGLGIPLPLESLHFTVADLLWDSAYRYAQEADPDYDSRLRTSLAAIFEQGRSSLPAGPTPVWQVLGCLLMPRAIGVCLVPKDADSYERLIQFRSFLYQRQELISLGVEQQYNFTAHITLGYLGALPPDLDRQQLCTTLFNLNQQWLDQGLPEFTVRQAQLRKFDDMTRYYREPDWPMFNF